MRATCLAKRSITLLLFSILLTGCVQLAPGYDKELYSDLTEVNASLLGFFSSVSMGTTKQSFPEREDTYHNLIGRVEALAMQSETRPIPDAEILEKINDYLIASDREILFEDSPPSVASLEQISGTLQKMRETDEDRGLTPGAVKIFKNGVVISMDQALTYEAFLNR
ncbi:hypothetical protein [Microbulbifer litoralis]|uniref:hypothetical protein n=1 Tax=Microbulbifer litoralis TaxID=2933965 RepID=UPI002028CC47|nr:hypothetical protein [Microbulbifer sp. GX H0434]